MDVTAERRSRFKWTFCGDLQSFSRMSPAEFPPAVTSISAWIDAPKQGVCRNTTETARARIERKGLLQGERQRGETRITADHSGFHRRAGNVGRHRSADGSAGLRTSTRQSMSVTRLFVPAKKSAASRPNPRFPALSVNFQESFRSVRSEAMQRGAPNGERLSCCSRRQKRGHPALSCVVQLPREAPPGKAECSHSPSVELTQPSPAATRTQSARNVIPLFSTPTIDISSEMGGRFFASRFPTVGQFGML